MTTGYACSSCPDCSCAQNNARFREYQRIMAEQAKASIAAREARTQALQGMIDSRIAEGERAVSATFGQATGQMAGLDAFLPKARTFTREEVLTVLRVLKMQDYSNDPDAVFNRIITTFERME